MNEPKDYFEFRKEEAGFSWKVPVDLPYFDGHFPNQPILPGIAILDASIELTRSELESVATPFVQKIVSLKFAAPIYPGDDLRLELTREEKRYKVIWKRSAIQVSEVIFELK